MRRINLKRVSVARPDMIRNINRQIILNYVREKEPISRAEIARETALNRSTVSIILDELKEVNLIEEVGTGESTGGRPPTLLRLRSSDAVAIGVDLGVTRTVIATSDLSGRVLEQEEFATAPEAEKTVRQIIHSARQLIRKSQGSIEGIGVSVPGLINPASGEALYVPRFKWRNLAITQEISSATGLRVRADNDANAAALAELWFGRPEVRDSRNFILVLIADGVGTGIVLDGQVYHGEHGVAGEYGHMTIGTGAPVACASGNFECWEAFVSERATLARYAKFSHKSNSHRAISFKQVVDEALSGERAARLALTETAHYLGVGISNLIKGLSPEAIIIGGNIVRAWPIIGEAVSEAVNENICLGLPLSRIIASTLGEQPSLMGALSLVLASKFASATTA